MKNILSNSLHAICKSKTMSANRDLKQKRWKKRTGATKKVGATIYDESSHESNGIEADDESSHVSNGIEADDESSYESNEIEADDESSHESNGIEVDDEKYEGITDENEEEDNASKTLETSIESTEARKLWVEVLSGNLNPGNGMKMSMVRSRLRSKKLWDSSLIMYVLGGELSMNEVKQFMLKMWNFVKLPDMYYNEERFSS
ncbi:unnamed protein product [Vicia faba]|uniref:Pentatricopeptide repeat-containing protein n=1 Tax=Vicia faba TaxID=3906 RepID=A0AAV1AWN6_VICFA|nr:unnamed protein product [Vicia faba]